MAYVTTKEMLLKAQREGYAVGAFNVENLEMAQTVIQVAEELQSPVILQTTSSTLQYAAPAVYAGMVKALARQATVPVALHLDHGSSFELAIQGLCAGYSSVMIDGSQLPLEENIKVTKEVVRAAHAVGIPVEAELGKLAGKEDDLVSETGDLTCPKEAAIFTQQTKVDSLAVAIGTAHGPYKTPPTLQVEQLSLIQEKTTVPLVLHGASGLSEEDIRACIQRGIVKINFATELRIAYTQGVREYLQANPKAFDPKAYGLAAKQKVAQIVRERMQLCGSGAKD